MKKILMFTIHNSTQWEAKNSPHTHTRTVSNKILHKNNNKRNRLGWQKTKQLENSQKNTRN